MRAILTYHSIDDSGSVISVSRDRFVSQMRWLASSGIDVLPVADLLSRHGDENAVAITFDDAFANFGSVAWPCLRDYGFPVSLFVPTSFVGQTNGWGATARGSMPTLPLLDWPALGRLADESVLLGAHTRTHADLRTLDRSAMIDEIAGSFADIVRETGRRAHGFAYPYGYLDQRVERETAELCSWACTTELGSLDLERDRHRLPRLDSYFLRGLASIEHFGAAGFRTVIAVRRMLRRVRGA